MRKYGLIGYPLTHSFSKKYFSDKFASEKKDCIYENYSIEHIELLQDIIKNNKELIGLNVTIPYKEKVMSRMNEIDDVANQIGAINTIKIIRQDRDLILKGFNTDAYGFENAIKPFLENKKYKAIIIGTGGSSKAVSYIFTKLGFDFIYVSRTPRKENQISYNDFTKALLSEYQIIVNTSPIGMYPEADKFPDIPYDGINETHLLFDLIYNPETTKFLQFGKDKGAKTINGLKMLYLQAEKSWEIWNKKD